MRYMIKIFTLLIVGLVSSLMAEENVIKSPPQGNLRYTIMVEEFVNDAGYSGKYSIGDGMTTAMTNILSKSGWFVVLGDKDMRDAAMKEQDFAASGRAATGKKAPKMGRITTAQLLVKGSITHVKRQVVRRVN